MGAKIQDKYGKRPIGYLGGIANSNPIVTKNDIAAEDMKIGKIASINSTGVVNLTATSAGSAHVAGVVMKSDIFKSEIVSLGTNLTLLKTGSIFVYCETDCIKGNTVYARNTINGDTEVGDVRKDNHHHQAIEIKAVFAETSNSGIVEIEINL